MKPLFWNRYLILAAHMKSCNVKITQKLEIWNTNWILFLLPTSILLLISNSTSRTSIYSCLECWITITGDGDSDQHLFQATDSTVNLTTDTSHNPALTTTFDSPSSSSFFRLWTLQLQHLQDAFHFPSLPFPISPQWQALNRGCSISYTFALTRSSTSLCT